MVAILVLAFYFIILVCKDSITASRIPVEQVGQAFSIIYDVHHLPKKKLSQNYDTAFSIR